MSEELVNDEEKQEKERLRAKIREVLSGPMVDLLRSSGTPSPEEFFNTLQYIVNSFEGINPNTKEKVQIQPWNLPLEIQLPLIHFQIIFLESCLSRIGIFKAIDDANAKENPLIQVAREVPRI